MGTVKLSYELRCATNEIMLGIGHFCHNHLLQVSPMEGSNDADD